MKGENLVLAYIPQVYPNNTCCSYESQFSTYYGNLNNTMISCLMGLYHLFRHAITMWALRCYELALYFVDLCTYCQIHQATPPHCKSTKILKHETVWWFLPLKTLELHGYNVIRHHLGLTPFHVMINGNQYVFTARFSLKKWTQSNQ